MKLKNICCPICNNEKHVFLYKTDIFSVSKCKRCNFIFLNPVASEEDYYNFYKSYKNGNKYDEYKIVFRRIKDYISKTGNLLDYGAGSYTGIKFLKKALKSYNFFTLEFDTCLPDGVCFDVVVMRHVLEHLLDVNSKLEKLHSVMDNDGVLYVAVPNLNCFNPPLLSNFFRFAHVYYFTRFHLCWLLEKHGFKPLLIDDSSSEIYGIFKKVIK